MTSYRSEILPSAGADRAEGGASAIRFEDLWLGVFENPRVGIVLVGSDQRFLATNARYQALVGYSDEELRSMSFLDITHSDDRAENGQLTRLWDQMAARGALRALLGQSSLTQSAGSRSNAA
jgi:PAS domain-containing protein